MRKNRSNNFFVNYLSLCFFILTFLFASSIYAKEQTIVNADFKLNLDNSMHLINEVENLVMHGYIYGGSTQAIQSTLAIEIVSMPLTSLDRNQRQFIAGMSHGLRQKTKLPEVDLATVFKQIQIIQLNNREFYSYIINSTKGKIKILTTIHKNRLYAFVISAYGEQTLANKRIQLLATQVAKITFT